MRQAEIQPKTGVGPAVNRIIVNPQWGVTTYGHVGTHNMRPPEMRMESRKDTSVRTKQNIELGWPRGQGEHVKTLVVWLTLKYRFAIRRRAIDRQSLN